MSAFQFNAVLLEISDQLTAAQLDQMKFLCGDTIGRRELETIDTGIRLFTALTHRGRLGADNKEYLCDLLQKIHRRDLSDKLNGFESQTGSANNQPDDEEQGTVV